ncbi:MAG: YitT family protein [Thermoplasmatales archaeon]|nr:YitT family protein [Thermoplasmatales archaeon]
MEGAGKEHLPRRIAVSGAALVLMAFAVVLATRAVLGTSPMSSVPYVLSLVFPITLGTANALFSALLIVLGVLIMGNLYRPIYLTQIATVAVFSVLCDVFAYLFGDFWIEGYVFQWLAVLASCAVLAVGVSLLVAANLTMMPPEYLIMFISFRTRMDFGKTKVFVDMAMVIAAAAISLAHFGAFVGVREGTVFTALALGTCMRYVSRWLEAVGFYAWIGRKGPSERRDG